MADVIPIIDPLGMVSLPVRKLAELLAECPSFQERANAAGEDEAMLSIHHPDYAGPALDEVPGLLAVVYSGPIGLARIDANHLRPDGCQLGLLLRDAARYYDGTAATKRWSQVDFENFLGVLIAELCERQGIDTRLTIQSVRQTQVAQLTPPRAGGEGKDYWLAAFEIEWSKL